MGTTPSTSTRSSSGSSARRERGTVGCVCSEVDRRTRVLILGSLPGRESLRRTQYYAHPRNAFWRLVGEVTGTDLVALPYPARLAALRAEGIGLWDVAATALRAGSLDSEIREIKPADLRGLIAGLPELRAVAFNGARAARIGQGQIAPGPDVLPLPSSSPAHATTPYAEKLLRWQAVGAYL